MAILTEDDHERCRGNGLILAGTIVTLIGLAVVATMTLEIPRYWTTVLVGLVLLSAGVLRRALPGRDGPPRGERP